MSVTVTFRGPRWYQPVRRFRTWRARNKTGVWVRIDYASSMPLNPPLTPENHTGIDRGVHHADLWSAPKRPVR